MDTFKNKDTRVGTLYNILYKKYGDDWLEFSPLSLWMDIKSDFKVNPSDEIKEKIMAMQTYLTGDHFFNSPVGFEKMILAFNGKVNNMRVVEMATPFEIAYGLKEAKTLKTYEPDDFDDDIIAYVTGSCKYAGFVLYPPEFKFMEPEYPRLSLEGKIKESYDKKVKFTGKWDPLKRQNDLLDAVQIYIEEKIKKGGNK